MNVFNKDTSLLTPNDVYALPTQEITRNPHILVGCYYDFLEDSGIDSYDLQYDACQDSMRLEIRAHKYFNFDGRRFWRLATVWFDNKPVMIIQNAGREGDDHRKRFITDPSLFWEMVAHIRTLIKHKEPELKDVVDPEAILGRMLIDFYNNSYDGYFERYW